jgi:hypothetical protein
MAVPTSLAVIICFLFSGLLYSITYSVRVEGRNPKYSKVRTNPGANENPPTNSGSYQHSVGGGYALPPSSNVVTYCVIDGRLIDGDGVKPKG